MDITFDVAEQLFPNAATMIVQLCSTAVIFIVAYKFLFNPVRDFLAKKSELANKELEDAKIANEEAKKNVEETRKQLKEASVQAKQIIEKGKDEGKIIKEEMIEDGRAQVDLMLKNAREEIAFEQEKMRQGIQKEIVDVALLATEKLLKDNVNEEKNRESIQAFIEGMNENE